MVASVRVYAPSPSLSLSLFLPSAGTKLACQADHRGQFVPNRHQHVAHHIGIMQAPNTSSQDRLPRKTCDLFAAGRLGPQRVVGVSEQDANPDKPVANPFRESNEPRRQHTSRPIQISTPTVRWRGWGEG